MWTRPLRAAPAHAEKPNQFQCIHDLSDAAVRKLTRYLYLSQRYSTAYPPEYWLEGQEKGMRELPSDCLRPRVDHLNVVNLVKRGLMSISEKHQLSFTPQAAVLCPTHRGLNPWVVHALFALVTKEITKETERLRRDRGGRNPQYSTSILEFLHRLDAIQALWMDPSTFELVFDRPPGTLERVASQCEACILSAIGSRHTFLSDLRAHLIARTKTATPVLQRIVEAWLTRFPEETQKSVNQESSFLAEEIRTVRREIAVARHKRRDARRQRKAHWSPSLSSKNSNTASTKVSQHSATGRQSTSSQQSLMSKGEDSVADIDGGNQPWEDDVGGFYERLATRNGNGYAFDRTSVHPAFGGPKIQSHPLQPQAFATELEVDRSEQEAIWKNAVSNSAFQTTTSHQSAMPSSSIGRGQQPPCNPLPQSMLQDESRASNRFRNIATSSVFSNSGPAQPAGLRFGVPPVAQSYTEYRDVAAPSSVYTNIEPAQPHPPQTNVFPFTARPQPTRPGPAKGKPSCRPGPDAAVSNPTSRPQDNRPVMQDYPSTGLRYCFEQVLPDPPDRPTIKDERLKRKEQSEIVERPTFEEYYENTRKPEPLPPSGRRQHYGRRPSPPPQPRPSTSLPQPGTPAAPGSPVGPEAVRALTLDEVRRLALARGPAAPSDVSTIWPQDSITSVGMPK
ncbi:hypothetical protein CI238_06211 [Colletotrichum incanum]|uniref:Uncharacterized protein n=1 Tax=Colletotrichum incanum TaxID=1573173 RepID=A0A166NUY7_COLIC|nr:hypothetical protein CI238_06211 [Colletotrichum incanum]OHW92142.1 hypothetical protein CSPAE12_09152 [Colletotrichum incanum]